MGRRKKWYEKLSLEVLRDVISINPFDQDSVLHVTEWREMVQYFLDKGGRRDQIHIPKRTPWV